MITKMHKYMIKGLLCCAAVAALTACNDFLTIYPTDRIVGDDFWKTKADVDQMVDGCYHSMLSYDIQERAIMWGAYRSDELVKLEDYNDNTLDNIDAVNLLPTNRYNSWSAFYKVINNCNIVLNHVDQVMEEDPEFTLGNSQVVRAQMLALRSLCYFYLVRAFRDVPYTTHSYEDDSQVELLEQSTPEVVLQNCLNDLEEANQIIMLSGAYGRFDWRNWGYFTKDAVNALMADCEGKAEQNLIQTVALRAMMKARYSVHNIGHYGLAFDYYTHFTSPIRRYPDTMVHRLLTRYQQGGRSANKEHYEEMCEHSSDMEQLAANAERDSIKYKMVEFMADKIGNVYEAHISGIQSYGIYCEIDENHCEGMVPMHDLDDDYYDFDERNYCLVGRRHHNKYQLGDPVTIRVARANIEKRQLDFTLEQ